MVAKSFMEREWVGNGESVGMGVREDLDQAGNPEDGTRDEQTNGDVVKHDQFSLSWNGRGAFPSMYARSRASRADSSRWRLSEITLLLINTASAARMNTT